MNMSCMVESGYKLLLMIDLSLYSPEVTISRGFAQIQNGYQHPGVTPIHYQLKSIKMSLYYTHFPPHPQFIQTVWCMSKMNW